jgi:hypothetical protein
MIVWVAALALAVSAQEPAPAEESLADKAARARKPAPAASPTAPAKVFTNDDLINAKGTVVVLPAPEVEEAVSDAETSEASPRPEPTDEEKRAQAGAALQGQIDEQVRVIEAARGVLADAERELNDLSVYTFGTRRAALMQNVDGARQAIADAQQSIEDLEDQARRQGIRVTVP